MLTLKPVSLLGSCTSCIVMLQKKPRKSACRHVCQRRAPRVCMPRRLEPAGSHGVWGLDDYQCLPFMWGASQLSDHAAFTPASIHKEALLREGAPDYLYFAAISFIRKVGPAACPQ